jgi:hypothetical protein
MREDHPGQRGVVAWYLAAVAMLSLAASQIFPMPFAWTLALSGTLIVLLVATAVLGMTKKKPAGLFGIGWISLVLALLFNALRAFDFIPAVWQAIGAALLLISVALFVISAIRRSW